MTGGRAEAFAAVLNRPGGLDLEVLQVASPGPHEVRIRPLHVGLCHSDLHYIDGTHTTTLPEVLGHEAAGVVESVGTEVASVRPGDHVVTSLTMFCGRCRYCVDGRLSLCSNRGALRARPEPSHVNADGVPVGVMGGIGAFAELVVAHESAVVRLPDAVPMDAACLLGCAVLTGVCAVTRAARVPAGATVAVVGCGGVGIAAVQGARLVGASRVIAVDTSPARLETAVGFGATDGVLSGDTLQEEVRGIAPEGVDFSFEAVGRQETAEAAFALLAPGGTCTVLGMVPDATPLRIPASSLYFAERRLQGAFIGSSRFVTDIPELAALYAQGRLKLDEMITHRVPLAEINDGFAVLSGGGALRVVVDMPATTR